MIARENVFKNVLLSMSTLWRNAHKLWMERFAADGGVMCRGIGEGISIKRLQINLIKDFF